MRALSSGSGSLTDSYDYDAFGVTQAASGSSVNPYRYSGEWYDSTLGQYYLRARYYAPQVGRFSQMDSWQGNNHDPITLHKYAYGNADPVNGIDPSGNMTLLGVMSGFNGSLRLSMAAVPAYSSAIGKALTGLVGAGLGYGLSEANKDFIAKNAPAMGRLLENKRASEEERVELESRGRPILYHYTSRAGALAIAATGKGFVTPSFKGLGTGGNTRPAGFYATDIVPWDMNMTQENLSALFYGGNRNRDLSWFVAVDATTFSPVYGTTREYVAYGSTSMGFVNVDVAAIGPNLMLPRM